MTPEIKHALEVIRDECRKHDCCNRHCELRNPDYEFCNGESSCRISERTPDEWDIEAWEKEKPMGEWISVKDRLPENDNHVLCCTETKKKAKNVIIGYYMDGAWRCGMNSNVTHWMPLPELPGGGNK